MGLAVVVMVGLEVGEVPMAWEVGKATQEAAAARHRPGECLLVSASDFDMNSKSGCIRGLARGRVARVGSIQHVRVWQWGGGTQLTMVMGRMADLLMANITAKDLGDAAAAPTARGAFSLSAIQVRAKLCVVQSTVYACLHPRAAHDRASWLSAIVFQVFPLGG